MSSAVASKNLRILLAACFVLVLFNIMHFFREDGLITLSLSKSDNVYEGGAQAVVGIDKLAEKSKKPVSNRILRKYFNDKANGLVVIAVSDGEVADDDFETKELEKLLREYENTDDKKYEIVQIRGYDYSSLKKLPPENLLDKAREQSKFKEELAKFMNSVMKSIADANPGCDKINNDEHYAEAKKANKYENKNGRMPLYGGHWRESYKNEPIRTEDYLRYFFRPTQAEVNALKESHRKFIGSMPNEIPKELIDLGEEESFMRGDGIVYLGGGRYNQIVLLSISMLRATGSKLPIEVIIPKRSDHDIDLCSTILPAYNGRCKIMEDYLPEQLMKNLDGFQLKNAALLASSFKNILFLDADNIPAANPDYLFVNEPFASQRMIMWPDLWRRSTSPSFYDVADIDYDVTHRMRNSYFQTDERAHQDVVSFHDSRGTIPEASSETGQMMIDKARHFRSLILAMYYNYYGPDYYYPLLSQGAAGEGDKETFIAAAHKLNLPYYQVNEFNREFGPLNSKNKPEFFGMGQYNAIIDYIESTRADLRRSPSKFPADVNDALVTNHKFHYYKASALMFLHANWPKFYIKEMFIQNSYGRGPKTKDDKRRRLYTDFMKEETHLLDLELEIMRHVKYWFCNRKVQLQDVPLQSSEERKEACQNIQEQIQYLQG